MPKQRNSSKLKHEIAEQVFAHTNTEYQDQQPAFIPSVLVPAPGELQFNLRRNLKSANIHQTKESRKKRNNTAFVLSNMTDQDYDTNYSSKMHVGRARSRGAIEQTCHTFEHPSYACTIKEPSVPASALHVLSFEKVQSDLSTVQIQNLHNKIDKKKGAMPTRYELRSGKQRRPKDVDQRK